MNLKTIALATVLTGAIISPGCKRGSSENIRGEEFNIVNQPVYGEMVKGKVGSVQHFWAWDVDGKPGVDEMITTDGLSYSSVGLGSLRQILGERGSSNLIINHYVATGINPENQFVKSGLKGVEDRTLSEDVRSALKAPYDLFR